MRFSNRELKDLTIAGIIISLAFAILLSGSEFLVSFDSKIISIFLIAFFSAGIGFLLHEIMHKYVAQKYNLRAEFVANYPMLWLALVMSFFGFIFAAPGAVYILGSINKEKNGKISVAGPLTNIVLALIFLICLLFYPLKEGILFALFSFGFSINSLLAAFNMIPALPFDGAKVILWNKTIYYIVLLVSVGLFILSFFI